MIKKILLLVFVGVLAGLGWLWYASYRNTPERAAEGFVRNVAKGDTDTAYNRLAAELTAGREAYWKEYLAQLKTDGKPPRLTDTEQVTDTFNTYTDGNDPHRFTYIFTLKDKTYQLVIIATKEGRDWKVDGLYGLDTQ